MDNERHGKDLEKSPIDVEARVKHAEQELSIVQEKRNRLASVPRLPPVQLLPDEVLAEIWNHLRGPELHSKYLGIPFSYVASWVSSRWRNVAIGTAGLWRNIYISPYQSVELVKIQLERSKTCSLNIWVAGEDSGCRHVFVFGVRDHHNRKMGDLAAVVLPSVNRWYSLECDGTEAYLAKILMPLRNAYAPQLKHLYLRFSRSSSSFLDPVFTAGAPNLAYVGFHNMSVSSNLTLLRGLNRLDLCNISVYGWAGRADFQSLLAACPLLTSLSISGRCFHCDSFSDSSTCMPSLASLRYCAVLSFDDFESDLFNAFSAPVLQSLELVNLGSDAYGTVVNIMNGNPPSARYPMLSKLSIFTLDEEDDEDDEDDDPPAFSEDAVQIFTLFPNINNLELICTSLDMPYIMEALGGERIDGAEPVCPRLRTLTCPPLSDDDESLVQDFITVRASLGLQVRKLDIDTKYLLDASFSTRKWLSENMGIDLDL